MGLDRTFEATPIISVDATTIGTSYAAVGDPLPDTLFMMIIKNSSDQSIFLSEDGSTEHYELLPGTAEGYPFQANRGNATMGVKAKGLQFYARVAPGNAPAFGKLIIQGQTL